MTDSQIVTRLKNRDKSALIDLYDHYASAFYGHAWHILESPTLAREVVQNTFLKIWNNIHQYDDSKVKLFTWMYWITRDEVLQTKRLKTAESGAIFITPEPTKISVEEDHSMLRNTAESKVKKVLSILDEDMKQILEFVYFKGHTLVEVASLTNLPVDMVRTKMRRAILKLRSVLIKE